jgi:glycosyltransferase involved in cell wall biosynthesis
MPEGRCRGDSEANTATMTACVPKISVVLPNYNHARELGISLAAIAAQTRPADEIVIVDDGSTDDSLEVIAGFAARCLNLRLIKHEQRQGVVAAVNRGVREASCDYVILASADECILPECCEAFGNAMAEFPQARLAVSKFTEWFPQTGELRLGQDNECDLWFLGGDGAEWVSPQRFHELLARAHIRLSVNSAMFERELLLEMGTFDPKLRWHSDWFAIYATAFRHGFVAIPRTLSWFRMEEDSYSSKGAANIADQEGVIDALFAKLDMQEFADVRSALMRSPSAMVPFMRTMLLMLVKRPRRYPEGMSVGTWWLKQFLQGRRPRAWARFLNRNIHPPDGEATFIPSSK